MSMSGLRNFRRSLQKFPSFQVVVLRIGVFLKGRLGYSPGYVSHPYVRILAISRISEMRGPMYSLLTLREKGRLSVDRLQVCLVSHTARCQKFCAGVSHGLAQADFTAKTFYTARILRFQLGMTFTSNKHCNMCIK